MHTPLIPGNSTSKLHQQLKRSIWPSRLCLHHCLVPFLTQHSQFDFTKMWSHPCFSRRLSQTSMFRSFSALQPALRFILLLPILLLPIRKVWEQTMTLLSFCCVFSLQNIIHHYFFQMRQKTEERIHQPVLYCQLQLHSYIYFIFTFLLLIVTLSHRYGNPLASVILACFTELLGRHMNAKETYRPKIFINRYISKSMLISFSLRSSLTV